MAPYKLANGSRKHWATFKQQTTYRLAFAYAIFDVALEYHTIGLVKPEGLIIGH